MSTSNKQRIVKVFADVSEQEEVQPGAEIEISCREPA